MAMEALGTFEDHDEDTIDVRFERFYPRPVETVWSAITEPARLADWMGVSEIEPFVGGTVRLMIDSEHPAHGEVQLWDPPKMFEFSWSNTHARDTVVRYELSPAGGGTRLIFTHQRMPYQTSALMLPGWHNFLSRLGATLEGKVLTESPSFRGMQAIYVDHYKLTGVMLDP